MQLLLGLDIETGGPVIGKHPLLAIGMSVYQWDGKHKLTLLDTVEVHMEGQESDYDRNTLAFWKKNPKAWEYVKSDTISNKKAAEQIVDFLKAWQGKGRVKIITDNCWFDDTFTSWFLCTYAKDGLHLRHNYYTGYSKLADMIDVNQRIAAMRELGCTPLKFKSTVPHDHTPVHDSMGIVEKYVNYVKSVNHWHL